MWWFPGVLGPLRTNHKELKKLPTKRYDSGFRIVTDPLKTLLDHVILTWTLLKTVDDNHLSFSDGSIFGNYRSIVFIHSPSKQKFKIFVDESRLEFQHRFKHDPLEL